jgi:hypothetical protein
MSPAPRRSTGGIDGVTDDVASRTEDDRPRSSAADVRRTIVVAFGSDKRLTPDEVERAVNLKLPHARHGLITTQLRVLEDGDYVKPVKGDSRQLTLTETGKRWLSGIRALSGESQAATN